MKKLTILFGLYFALHCLALADPVPQMKHIQPLQSECIVGQPVTALIPLSGTGYITVDANWYIFDVTGTKYTDSTGTQSLFSDTSDFIEDRYYQKLAYTPTIVGTLVLSVTDTSLDEWASWTTRIVAPGNILQSTMYYLSSSIARDATWTYSDAVIRSCSAYYDSALEECYINDQGGIVDYHVILYDYSTEIDNYVQKRWDFWNLNQAQVKTTLQRGVPDADETRYKVQE